MMKKDLGPLTTFGFARYNTREGVSTEQLIEVCLKWRKDFLDHQNGIAFHCLLGNLNGGFADTMLAVDQAAFDAMAAHHREDESSKAFVSLLDPDSIRLASGRILKPGFRLPNDFSCIEFGTFDIGSSTGFSEDDMLRESHTIETQYLAHFSDSREHFMGKLSDETYAEVAFVESLGAARTICEGYTRSPVCSNLLSMFDPASVDLDFWFVLA